MSASRKLNPAMQKILQSIATNSGTFEPNASDQRRQKMLALRESYERMQRTPAEDFKPGDLVRYQPRMKCTTFPAYGEFMVVVEVLKSPIINERAHVGSPYFRSPDTFILGGVKNGNFHCWHYDGRRFEKVSGSKP